MVYLVDLVYHVSLAVGLSEGTMESKVEAHT
jgi:hypothetical protein